MKWFNKSRATSPLSATDALMMERGGVTKTCTLEQVESFIRGFITERVFAYMVTPAPTVMVKVDTWYKLQGVFTNSILEGFEIGTEGIKYIGAGSIFKSDYMTGGNLSGAAVVKIGIVKNATFDHTTNEMLTGIVFPGSGGLDECTTMASASGFGNPRGFYSGALVTDDEIVVVIQSNSANKTWTPIGASIHRFI